jgi:IclR family mhp operon transcriptional activator
MSKQDAYRGTSRTLVVLRSLNADNGASITQLSRSTQISRTALYRILQALVDTGYVQKRGDDGGYFLTSLVQGLSDGFKDEYWITEIAIPVLGDLQRRVVWPTDLGVLRNGSIKLAATTRRHSPLVIDRGLVGVEMPLLRTALGMAYLAYASPAERDTLLAYLAKRPNTPDSELARNHDEIIKTLKQVRRQGYSHRYGDSYAQVKYPDLVAENATIAVPITVNKYSIASLGITFIASALTIQEAIARHLHDLKAAALDIEHRLAAVTLRSV